MFKKLTILALFTLVLQCSHAQLLEPFVHQGEFGFSTGLAHYFGDLNDNVSVSHPKMAAGIFYRKQFNNYVGMKVAANYMMLGYSDVYSSNPVQKARNLSFNTDVWELTLSGDFNFFKFYPGFSEFRYTPYVSLGVGVFSYDPYAYLNGVKNFLRPLGTEGQGSSLYPNLKPYSNIAICIPIAVGFKYALNEGVNLFGEISYRFTTTDYLDDVSGSYAPDAFPPDANGNPTVGYLLQDRSYETGTPIGIKGRQRGNSLQKDSYASIQFGVSFNLQSYRCPKH